MSDLELREMTVMEPEYRRHEILVDPQDLEDLVVMPNPEERWVDTMDLERLVTKAGEGYSNWAQAPMTPQDRKERWDMIMWKISTDAISTKQLAGFLGLTRSRVHQMEHEFLRKLRSRWCHQRKEEKKRREHMRHPPNRLEFDTLKAQVEDLKGQVQHLREQLEAESSSLPRAVSLKARLASIMKPGFRYKTVDLAERLGESRAHVYQALYQNSDRGFTGHESIFHLEGNGWFSLGWS